MTWRTARPGVAGTGRLAAMRDWVVGGAVIEASTPGLSIVAPPPGAVLLVENQRPNGGRDWTPPGGVIDAGEAVVDGLTREVREETGLRADPRRLIGPVWRRESLIHFNGAVMASAEFYFVLRAARFEPSPAGRTALERRYIHGHRWCDAAAIGELVASGQQVYPLQLAELLEEADAVATTLSGPGDPRLIH